ncbi:MAG: PQQ-binding-like beta-propeller repeat protein [Proteobacteria bacterium]|nr:PQQ-binding-like beta-propeller repeat protein [Pseudomonadota bacterium]
MKHSVHLLLIVAGLVSAVAQGETRGDWPMFGGNPQSTSANPVATGISAANVTQLARRQVALDGTVDASAIFLEGVEVGGARHDAIFVTTTYGKTIAIDAGSGAVLWEFTPPGYSSLAGSRQITNSTPAADGDRRFIYAASPDGYVQKLSIGDGQPAWRASLTKLALREKIASPLKFVEGRVVAVTAGYIGDRPPYQGHVAVLDGKTGQLLQVWNSLCSNRSGLLEPDSCPESQSAIWGRAGAVIDPDSGAIFVATGNGTWNGTIHWGDALVQLDAGATKITGNYTPENTAQLQARDLDLGSTSPVLLEGDLIAQGGKDGKIRLLSRAAISGSSPHKGGELQVVSTPSGTDLFSQPVVWQHDGATWMFAADNGGTAAWVVENSRLKEKWRNSTGGTSPFEADGLLYVYARSGGLNVYEAASGKRLATLPCGAGHWNSPIVVRGRVILPEGNANEHAVSGVLDIWSLPGKAN